VCQRWERNRDCIQHLLLEGLRESSEVWVNQKICFDCPIFRGESEMSGGLPCGSVVDDKIGL
jgi:hypothetical protein